MDFLFCRWALAQTGILLVMGAWQMRHLKSFFEAKKLVKGDSSIIAFSWDVCE